MQLLHSGAVKFVEVDLGIASTDLVAAVAGNVHGLLGGVLVAGASGATFQIRSTTTNIFGTIVLGNNGVLVLPTTGVPYCETVVGEILNINVTAGALDGGLVYQTHP